MEAAGSGTHCVDPRELLRELQKDGNDNWLAVGWRAKELQDGDLPLHFHLPLLLLHLCQHVAHIQPPCQPLQACTNLHMCTLQKIDIKEGKKNSGILTSLGLVLLTADDVEEPGTLRTEGQKGHLKNSWHDCYTQQDWPQVLTTQQLLQAEDLHREQHQRSNIRYLKPFQMSALIICAVLPVL